MRTYTGSGIKTFACSQVIVVLCLVVSELWCAHWTLWFCVHRLEYWDVNNDNPQGQWCQDCCLFTVVPRLLCVHRSLWFCVHRLEQRDVNNDNPQSQWYQDCDVFTVVPRLWCVQWYQDCGVFTVVPRLSCVHRSLWFCVHRLEHWDVNNENLHGQWYQDALQDPDYNLELFRIAHHYDPSVKLFLNDYSVVASGSSTNVSSYSQHTACKTLILARSNSEIANIL